jgi:hypothetical protein
MKVCTRVLALIFISGIVTLSGCISGNEEKVDGLIGDLKADSKFDLSVDSLIPNSKVTINYSLELHNQVVGNRYRIEVEFKSGLNQFIQWYGTESFATDSIARYLWSFPRTKSQVDTQIIANLKINGIQLSSDTAIYQGNGANLER